jgi:YhcG PDDEXK nuclease domain
VVRSADGTTWLVAHHTVPQHQKPPAFAPGCGGHQLQGPFARPGFGAGFAFVGRQFRLEVAGDEFFIDLLFYHTRLKCYVVVELKATAFKPEHAGQLNFYLAAVDALSGIDKPIGVAEYQLLRDLPPMLEQSLPSIADIEAELAGDMGTLSALDDADAAP